MPGGCRSLAGTKRLRAVYVGIADNLPHPLYRPRPLNQEDEDEEASLGILGVEKLESYARRQTTRETGQ